MPSQSSRSVGALACSSVLDNTNVVLLTTVAQLAEPICGKLKCNNAAWFELSEALSRAAVEDNCFSLLLPFLSKPWNLKEMSKLLQLNDVWRHPVRCVTAEGAAMPSFGFLHTAEHLDSALAGIAGSQGVALGINISCDTFLTADISWVLVRGLQAEVSRKKRGGSDVRLVWSR